MLTWRYRLTLVGCVLSWFMLGLHLPTLHDMSHAGAGPRWDLLGITLGLAVLSMTALWALLRAPRGRRA